MKQSLCAWLVVVMVLGAALGAAPEALAGSPAALSLRVESADSRASR